MRDTAPGEARNLLERADPEILQRTKKLMQQGIAGIVYGRNIIKHPKPAAITAALMGIVHHGKSVSEGLDLIDKS